MTHFKSHFLLKAAGIALTLSYIGTLAAQADESTGDPQRAEQACYRANTPDPETADCLEGVADAWFHLGDYPQAIRIHKAQLILDPTRVDDLTNATYLMWSIEVDDVVSHKASDLTQKPLQYQKRFDKFFQPGSSVLAKLPAAQRDVLPFYYHWTVADLPLSIVTQKMGSPEIHAAYYLALKQEYCEALRTFPSAKKRLPSDGLSKIYTTLRVERRVLTKNAGLDPIWQGKPLPTFETRAPETEIQWNPTFCGPRNPVALLKLPILLSLLLLRPSDSTCFAQTGDALSSARELVASLRGQPSHPAPGQPVFRARNCPKIPPDRWVKFLLLNQPIDYELRFAEGCDLQGKVHITRERFPVDLQVRHVAQADRIQGEVETQVTPQWAEQQLVLTLRATRGKTFLKSASAVLGFSFDYTVVGGLDGKLKENRGGTLHLTSYQGKAVKIDEPFKFETPHAEGTH